MSKLDLFNKPVKSYLIYQSILLVIGFVFIFVLSYFIDLNVLNVAIGYFTGCFAITIGFLLIVYSSDKILDSVYTTKSAKSISLMYFSFRYMLYLVICGISIKFFNANILAIIVGMFSLKFIIYIDSILTKNGGDI